MHNFNQQSHKGGHPNTQGMQSRTSLSLQNNDGDHENENNYQNNSKKLNNSSQRFPEDISFQDHLDGSFNLDNNFFGGQSIILNKKKQLSFMIPQSGSQNDVLNNSGTSQLLLSKQQSMRQKSTKSPLKMMNQSQMQLPQFAIGENTANEEKPKKLTSNDEKQLRTSLELISPSEIEKALKKLRTINETKPSKALANPSVIFSHCIDEEDVVRNIKGLAREMHNANLLRQEFNQEIEQRGEILEGQQIETPSVSVDQTAYFKLFYGAEQRSLRLQKIREDQEKKLLLAQRVKVSANSQKILQQKQERDGNNSYVKIQDRVESIIANKQRKIEQASILRKLQDDAQFMKAPSQADPAMQSPFNQNQRTPLDYSVSHEYTPISTISYNQRNNNINNTKVNNENIFHDSSSYQHQNSQYQNNNSMHGGSVNNNRNQGYGLNKHNNNNMDRDYSNINNNSPFNLDSNTSVKQQQQLQEDIHSMSISQDEDYQQQQADSQFGFHQQQQFTQSQQYPQQQQQKMYPNQQQFHQSSRYFQRHTNHGYTQKQLQVFLDRTQKRQNDIQESIVQQKLIKEQKEMANATFHPKINKKSALLSQAKPWEPIEARFERITEEYQERRKQQQEAEYKKYLHSPLINKKSIKIVDNKSASKSPSTKSFFRTPSTLSKSSCNTSRNALRPATSNSVNRNSKSINKTMPDDTLLFSFNQNMSPRFNVNDRGDSFSFANDNNTSFKRLNYNNSSFNINQDSLANYTQNYSYQDGSKAKEKIQRSKSAKLSISKSFSQQQQQQPQQQQGSPNLSQPGLLKTSTLPVCFSPSERQQQYDGNRSSQFKNDVPNNMISFKNENKFLLGLVSQKKS